MKKIFKVLLYIISSVALLAVFVIKPVDWTPYQKTEYYQETLQNIDSVKNEISSERNAGPVEFGWAKANITPDHPVNLIAYGQRGPFQQVHDSAWVKAFVFQNKKHKVALLAYDLWIVHPYLAGVIREKLNEIGISEIYFAADHTHNGFGGWAPGLGGKLIAGGYDQKVIDQIGEKTIQAVQAATSNSTSGKVGFSKVNAGNFVRNRLIENGKIDPWLRFLDFETDEGRKAVFCTFSAHSTYISSSVKELSSDYPGYLVKYLVEEDTLDLAAFASGAIGSHSPAKYGDFSYSEMEHYADSLADLMIPRLDSLPEQSAETLKFVQLPIGIRDPHFRISENWRIRPWLFNWFFGEQHPYFTCLRLGNTVLIGSPGEISGEFYPRFSEICKKKNLNLILTTFNGNYLGYITPDEYYSMRRYETRDMNWFGPYNGDYFVEIINRLLEVI